MYVSTVRLTNIIVSVSREMRAPWLASVLVPTGYRESRYNTAAINPEGGPNATRGLFGLRPDTALAREAAGLPVGVLVGPAFLQVPLAAYYAYRLIRYSGASTLGGIVRGWRLPSLVNEEMPQDMAERWAAATEATGISPDLGAPVGPVIWPGLGRVLWASLRGALS
jgi:hypothetical protein